MQHRVLRSSTVLAALAATALAAQAQTPFQLDAQVVAESGGNVPGVAGATFLGGGAFDAPVLDANGAVLFRAQFAGGGATSADDRALFFGGPGGLSLLARGGDQAPGLPVGTTLSTTTGAPGFTSIYRVGPNADSMWVTSVWNGGATTANDTAIIVGQPSGLTPLVREGDPAPGTVGATFSTNFTTTTFITTGTLGANASATYLFKSLLAGGDVVGSTNNDGWWVGGVGGLQLLVRRGDVMPGPGGFVIGTLVGPAQNAAKLNAAGQVLWEGQYNSTFGSPAPTSLDNQPLYLSTAGGNHTLIAREGDPVPGLSSAFYGAAGGISTWGITGTSLDASGNVLFKTDLRGSVTTDDDQAVMYCPSGGVPYVVFRENDPAPGLPGVFLAATFNSSLQLNDLGRFVVVATVRGAGVTAANDGSLWAGNALTAGGALQLVGREGDPAPGTAGALLGSISTTTLVFNNSGNVIVSVGLTGGDVSGSTNDSALYQWSPSFGLTMLAREGDAMPQLANQVITGWTIFQNDNSATSNLGFNQTGRIAARLSLGANQAIVVYDANLAPPPTAYCTAGTSTNACVPAISASAQPSASLATPCTLSVANVEGQKQGLIFYGLDQTGFTPLPWGAGSSFLCVKSPTQRTTPGATGGTLNGCDGALSVDWNAFQLANPIALGNPFAAGAKVYAQGWYRDPPASKTTNLSDAIELTCTP